MVVCRSPLRYRAVSGEMFMMPCKKWFRVGSHNHSVAEKDFAPFKAETAHSGNYTCFISTSPEVRRDFLLQIVNKTMECSSPDEDRTTLKIGAGGNITCPGHNCSSGTPTVWYKGNKSVNEMKKRGISVREGRLHLRTVYRYDSTVFFCDRVLSERGVNWTMRRSVTVKALSSLDKERPRILSPRNNMEQEVVLGTDHTLRCETHFPQADPPGDVRWVRKSSGHLVNLTMEKLEEKELEWDVRAIGKATLRKVTAQDLNGEYTCIAQNTSGNKSATIFLKKKNIVQWSSLVEYALGPLLLVTGLTIVLRVKWLEIQLILKSRWTFGKTDVGHKDFDVLLSYVWRTSSMELNSPPLRHNSAFPFKLDPLEVEIPSKRPELLLPHVLEDQWGYRLCLMERDYLPGGGVAAELWHQAAANMDQHGPSPPRTFGPTASCCRSESFKGATSSEMDVSGKHSILEGS
uniref:Ig-like domain-containing protein n=1 Tax=Neogobius melanostomus TaxID=47308 RepID=A0A8C6T9U5_9GOBI